VRSIRRSEGAETSGHLRSLFLDERRHGRADDVHERRLRQDRKSRIRWAGKWEERRSFPFGQDDRCVLALHVLLDRWAGVCSSHRRTHHPDLAGRRHLVRERIRLLPCRLKLVKDIVLSVRGAVRTSLRCNKRLGVLDRRPERPVDHGTLRARWMRRRFSGTGPTQRGRIGRRDRAMLRTQLLRANTKT
jgi:hypothetical protein